MMKKCIFSIFALIFSGLLVISSLSCKSEKTEYIDEFGCYEQTSSAIEAATADSKNILLVVTMNGDDHESDTFTNEFFKSPDFKTTIAENYTLLHIDLGQATFERTVAGANASKKEQQAADDFAAVLQINCRFAELLGINYTPCLFLLTKQGYFISEIPMGISEYAPAQVKKVLDSFESLTQEFNELADATENGDVVDRVKAIDTLYERTDENHRILLMDLTRKVVDIDFNNKSGLLSKYLFETAVNLAMYCSMDNDIDGAVKSMVSITSNVNLEPADKQNAWYMAAYILLSSYSTDFQTILTYLEAAMMSDPENPATEQIQQLYDYVKSTVDEQNAQNQAQSGAAQ